MDRGRTLVLGLPGQVASCLVQRLLAEGESLCVIAPPHFDTTSWPDVTVYRGDLTAIDFGLSGAEYLALAAEARQVIYAAEPRHVEGERLERSFAVRSAMELLEFSLAGGARDGVVFSSSLLCLGTPKQPVSEGALAIDQEFPSKYEESLAIAEKIVRRIDPSCPLSVVRSAPVAGNALTGELAPEAPLTRLAARIRASPLLSEIAYRDEPVRFETADRLAEALARLSRTPVSTTVHMCDEVALTDRMLIEFLLSRLGRAGGGPGPMPFRTRMSLPEVPASYSVLGWPARFEREQAKRLLGDLLDPQPFSVLEAFFPPSAATT